MRKIVLGSIIGVGIVVVSAAAYMYATKEPAINPDPNHTHADFAVWMNGEKIDFNKEAFMSGSSEDKTHEGAHHPYLHLHDSNGQVIHRHKPGLTLNEFFRSIGVRFTVRCFKMATGEPCLNDERPLRMFVNGEERLPEPDYIFEDTDHILITDSDDAAALENQLEALSDDACLYSQTCPWRGKPPIENCIADPEVPCVIPE